jgi:hypothetical protein
MLRALYLILVTRVLVTTLILWIAFILPSPDIAYSAKKVTVIPRISIQEQYDDNIDLDPDNEESDWITSIAPGFLLDLESESTSLNLDFDVGFSFYLQDSSRDTIQYRGALSWNQRLADRLSLEVMNNFSRTDEPIGPEDEIASERAVRYRNLGQANLSWQFGQDDTIVVGYQHNLFESESDDEEDGTGHLVFLNVQAWAVPQFGINFRPQFWRANFKQPSGFVDSPTDDFSQYSGELTVNYRWRQSRLIHAKYSELYQDFDQPGVPAPSNDFRLRQATLGFTLTLSPQVSIQVNGGYWLQTFQDNTRPDNDGPIFHAVLAAVRQNTSLHLEGESGFVLDFLTPENFGSTEFRRALGSVDYQLTERVRLLASASYLWQDFLELDRRDKDWRTTAGLSYTVRDRLELSLDVTHRERESTNPSVEFVDNRVTLLLTLEYPWKIK